MSCEPLGSQLTVVLVSSPNNGDAVESAPAKLREGEIVIAFRDVSGELRPDAGLLVLLVLSLLPGAPGP